MKEGKVGVVEFVSFAAVVKLCCNYFFDTLEERRNFVFSYFVVCVFSYVNQL